MNKKIRYRFVYKSLINSILEKRTRGNHDLSSDIMNNNLIKGSLILDCSENNIAVIFCRGGNLWKLCAIPGQMELDREAGMH